MAISTNNAVRQSGLAAPTSAPAANQASVDPSANAGAPSTTASTASGATSAAQAPSQAPSAGGGLFGFVADIFIGGGEAALDMVKGVGTMIAHPIKTVEGLGYAVTHPGALVHAFVDPYAQAIAEGRPGLAIGRGIVDVGTFLIPGVGLGGGSAEAAGKAGALAVDASTAAADAGKVATVAGDAGKVATVAGDAGKVATVAGDAGKVATVAGDAGKVATVAGKAGKVAEAAGKAGKVAEAAGKAGKAVDFAARLADKPIMTKAAQLALKDAGVSGKVGKAALEAAHSTYWESRAAGMSAKAAESAAAAKAAQMMGVAQDSAAAAKLASGARLAGAAIDKADWFTRTNFVEAPLVAGAKAVGGTVDKGIVATVQTGKVVADAAQATACKIGTAVSELGDITLGQIARAPIVLAEDAGKAVVDASKAVAAGVTKTVDELGNVTLGDIVMAPVTAVKAGAAAIGRAADAIGSMSVGQILGGAIRLPGTLAKAALANPAALIKPLAIAGMANSIGQGALATIGGLPSSTNPSSTQGGQTPSLSSQQVQQIAQQYGLQPTAQNVQNFVTEVQSYASNAIGPDSGTADQVKQLQTVLRALGYDVNPTGKWDNTTAAAVIDFKKQHGIHQTYNMADGTPAVNEYVDPATAQAMVDALKQGWKAGSATPGSSSSTSPSGSSTSPSGSSSSTSGSASSTSGSASSTAGSASSTAGSASSTTGSASSTTGSASSTTGSASSTTGSASSTGSSSATAPTTPTAPTAPTTASTASVSGATDRTYTVTPADRKDGLWGIAARYLGDAGKWPEIYALNQSVIGPDPNIIIAGEVLKMPADAKGLPGQSAAATPSASSTPATASTTASTSTSAAAPAPASNSPASPQLTAAQVSQLAKQYGLAPDAANVQAFANEVAGYQTSALGPDVGTSQDITKLQQVLIQLGYSNVKANGTFDAATASAVIDFKQKQGLHQSYKLANGDWAINEYVDQATAEAMANALSVNTTGN